MAEAAQEVLARAGHRAEIEVRNDTESLQPGATLDRFASDQIIPFAALAAGESRFLIPTVTDHVLTSAWLAEEFLDARVAIDGQRLTITGVGFWPDRDRTAG